MVTACSHSPQHLSVAPVSLVGAVGFLVMDLKL